MNESSGKSSGSKSRESTIASQVRCLLPSCCCFFWFSVWGVGNERGVRAGADWIDHSIQMIAHGGFKRVFFRSLADRS